MRTRRNITPLHFSKYFQDCFKLFNKYLVICTMYRAMFLFYLYCHCLAFFVVFTAISYTERKLNLTKAHLLSHSLQIYVYGTASMLITMLILQGSKTMAL